MLIVLRQRPYFYNLRSEQKIHKRSFKVKPQNHETNSAALKALYFPIICLSFRTFLPEWQINNKHLMLLQEIFTSEQCCKSNKGLTRKCVYLQVSFTQLSSLIVLCYQMYLILLTGSAFTVACKVVFAVAFVLAVPLIINSQSYKSIVIYLIIYIQLKA